MKFRIPVFRISVFIILSACLLLTTCRKDNPSSPNPPDNPDQVSQNIGPDGGTLSSKDGTLALTIPEGALGDMETITIEEITAGDLGPEFDEIIGLMDADKVYELGPDGLQFQKPATVVFTSGQTPVQGNDSLSVSTEFLFTSDNGQLEVLDSLRVEADTDSNRVNVSGQLHHFSPLLEPVQISNGVYFSVDGVPNTLQVGDQFEANVLIASTTEGPFGGIVSLEGPATYLDDAGAPLAATFPGAPDADIPLDEEAPAEADNRFKGTFSYTCIDPGLGLFNAELQVNVSFNLDAGAITATSYSNFTGGIECIEPTSNVNLQVAVAGDGSGTVTSDPTGINCPGDCDEDYPEGTTLTLTAKPDEGSAFTGWSGEAPDDCADNAKCTFAVTDARNEIAASFEPVQNTAPVINSFGGELTGPRTVNFQLRVEYEGDLSLLDATIDPDDGSGAQDVSLEAADAENQFEGTLEYQYGEGEMFMPKAEITDIESEAGDVSSFEIGEVTLTVTKEGNGTGSVTGTGPFGIEVINCGPACMEDSGSLLRSSVFGTSKVSLTAEPESNSVFEGWSGDLLGSNGCEGTEDCTVSMDQSRTVTATFGETIQGDVLETGLVFLAVLGNPEALLFLASRAGVLSKAAFSAQHQHAKASPNVSFGPVTGAFPVAIAGAEGFAIIDLATGEVLLDETGFSSTGPFFGVGAVSQDPPGPNSEAVLEAFGQNGSVFTRFDKFGSVAGSYPTFDIFPAGGDVISNVMTVVRPSREVGFWVFDSDQGIYLTATSDEFDDAMFDGELVSAYMHDDRVTQPRGSFLVLTRDTESKLYLGTWDPKQATEVVANLGSDARKVRCVEDGSGTGNLVCAVSVYGDDRLAILTWDGETEPTLSGYTDVGDGPVDIDLGPLSNGNVAIVSTGFNDNTVTETEVAPDGGVISNNTRPVLEGCQGPGHAIYLPDAESLKIVGTCYDSGHYFIMESGL